MYTDKSPSTRFGLIRHAETVWNRERRIQGQQDTRLTAQGVAMARGLGRGLAVCVWDRILTSNLARAVRTGCLINETLGVPQDVQSGIQEMDWGAWTGQTMAEIRRIDPERLALVEADFWYHRPPGGETRQQLFARSSTALIHAARRHPGETILVVTHAGVLKALFQGLLGSTSFRSVKGSASGNLYFFTSDGTTLEVDDSVAIGLPS